MADSPTTVPSAITRPTVPGAGSSGSSSRTPKIVVVDSNPGSEATRTATISSCAHSFVESGHRPETTNPFKDPPEWKGATSTAPPGILCPSRLRSVLAQLAPDTAVGRSRQHAAARGWHDKGTRLPARHRGAGIPGRRRGCSRVATLLPPDGPHHAVRTRRRHPAELSRVHDARRVRVVGAGLERRAATGAADVADAFDEPAGGQRRVGKHPHLASPRPAAAQREQSVARVERRAASSPPRPRSGAAASAEKDGCRPMAKG